MKLFVTGIGTDVGKTVVSAILCQATGADYWKPIQAGLEETDSHSVIDVVTKKGQVFPERYRLQKPASPHDSARAEGKEIKISEFELPNSDNLIVEGAGGLMVPINDSDMIVDLIDKLKLPVVLVASLYLGSINHTLLSVNELKRRGIKILGIVFNGESNVESEQVILKHAGCSCVLRVKPESAITSSMIETYASKVDLNQLQDV